MKTKGWIIAIFATALLLAVVAVVFNSLDRPVDASFAEGASAESSGKALMTNRSDPRSESTSAERSEKVPTPTESSKLDQEDESLPTRPSGHGEKKAPETKKLEVPKDKKEGPKKLPKSKKRAPVLTSLPKSGSATGKLSRGFPAKVVPMLPKAVASSSSVQTQGEQAFVEVTGRTKAETKSVLKFYSKDFAGKGWVTTQQSTANGVTTLRGAYGDDSILVTVRRLPTGQTSFAVAGVFKVDK